jgi:outer membrane receptor for ferrienterochelin and colicins
LTIHSPATRIAVGSWLFKPPDAPMLQPSPALMRRSRLALAAMLSAMPCAVTAQEPSAAAELDTIVVTAERIPAPAFASPTAVQIIAGDTLRAVPARNLAEALQSTPGFVFLSFDGTAGRPLPITRGFYGGGETGYLQILIDGVAVNRSESGLVAWDMVPLSAIERVEIVRGASSAQHGDAAVGGVINIITRTGRWSMFGLEAGSFGRRAIQGSLGDRDSFFSRMYGSAEQTDGFRDHSERTAYATGSTLSLVDADAGDLSLRTVFYEASAEVPGALTARQAAQDRTASDPFYQFDQDDETRYSATLDGRWRPSARMSVATGLSGTYRTAETTRTLPFSPFFADTQRNDVTSRDVQLSAQWSLLPVQETGGTTVIGVQLGRTWLDTRYGLILRGPVDVYDAALSQGTAVPLVHGEITRDALAAFAQRDWWLGPNLRLIAAVRGDWLEDESSLRGRPGSESEQSLAAWSGRTGLSWTFADDERQKGSVYAAVSREFRAPTLVQLFDPRPIPTPFGDITLSNPGLAPQVGTGFEAGLNHRQILDQAAARSLSLSLAIYHLDIRDEIDFDLAAFRYGNIGRSIHRGLEAGVELHFGAGSVFANYTRQDVENEETGLQLKAVPRDTANLGWRYAPDAGFNASVVGRYVGSAFLDDANLQRLDDFTTVDLRVGYRHGALYLYVEAFNLLDERYASTGYVLDYQTSDGGFGRETYLYPAPGRSVQAAVQWTF